MAERERRVIVLTGATQGLGRSLADRFIEAGHVVAGCGRSATAIDSLQAQHPEGGRKVQFALGVFAERHDGQLAGTFDGAVGGDGFGVEVVFQAPDQAGNVVAVNVMALEFGQFFAAIDGSAGNRLADAVMVFPNRVDEALL